MTREDKTETVAD